MAKAQFQKNQRVWVGPVGVWATVEKVVPIWAKGFGEPVRVTYDVGLGREFLADELQAEERVDDPTGGDVPGQWRLLRARNKWQQPEDCPHHPFPGTYPVVVTDPQDWGGWRVPGAEYDRDPQLIEMQARLIACAPKLLKLARDMIGYGRNNADFDDETIALIKRAEQICRAIDNDGVTAASPKSKVGA